MPLSPGKCIDSGQFNPQESSHFPGFRRLCRMGENGSFRSSTRIRGMSGKRSKSTRMTKHKSLKNGAVCRYSRSNPCFFPGPPLGFRINILSRNVLERDRQARSPAISLKMSI